MSLLIKAKKYFFSFKLFSLKDLTIFKLKFINLSVNLKSSLLLITWNLLKLQGLQLFNC